MNATMCPCGTTVPPILKYELPLSRISHELEKFAAHSVDSDLNLRNYDIVECATCGLVFASPLIQGSQQFYNWVAQYSREYYHDRWEYRHLLDLWKTAPPGSLMDVGCGDGQFIASVSERFGTDVSGLDIASESVEKAVARGLNVLKSDLFSINDRRFDVITAFHVLEHVEDPYAFVRHMLSLLNVGGRVFLSMPYSPTPIEFGCFQIMNHPPHHLTRWNARALTHLAQSVNCRLVYHLAEQKSVFWRAAVSFLAESIGPRKAYTKQMLMWQAALSPLSFLRHLRGQSRRDVSDNGRPFPDIVMIELIPRPE